MAQAGWGVGSAASSVVRRGVVAGVAGVLLEEHLAARGNDQSGAQLGRMADRAALPHAATEHGRHGPQDHPRTEQAPDPGHRRADGPVALAAPVGEDRQRRSEN